MNFLLSSFALPSKVYAQSVLNLPVPGTMIAPSVVFCPAIITGMTIHPENPLQFDFIVDIGDDHLQDEALKKESNKLINYFMATLTVPEDEMWVNLSPYEKNRIIANGLSKTEMGRDMLAQDYILKQLTASFLYPEGKVGQEFWQRVYSRTQEKFGTTEIPIDLFNKVWIIPQDATVYVNGNNVFVTHSHLKVMLEQDYLALENNQGTDKHGLGNATKNDIDIIGDTSAQIIREVLLPEIEKEVNQGKNFANLRQIYNSMILATWYKKKLKNGLLGNIYFDKNKTNGIELEDKDTKEKIYNQYLEAFKKGVYNYIKEDYDEQTQEVITRKYFSGGLERIKAVDEQALPIGWLGAQARNPDVAVNVRGDLLQNRMMLGKSASDQAMLSDTTDFRARLIGVFPSFGSISYYNELGSFLYDTGIPEIKFLYMRAAKVLNILDEEGRPDVQKVFFKKENLPENSAQKRGFFAALFLVHNLALKIYLEKLAEKSDLSIEFAAYTGESSGIVTSAVASGAISLEDAVKLEYEIFSKITEESERQPPNHIFTLKGPEAKQALVMLQEKFGADVEPFKYYSEGEIFECKIFVSDSILNEFQKFISQNFEGSEGVQISLLQGNNRFSSHTAKMSSVRQEIEKFVARNIEIRDPQTPVISNNNMGYLKTAEDVRQAVLATIDVPMSSGETVKLAKELRVDAVVELGRGGKAMKLFVDNRIQFPHFVFDGENPLDKILSNVVAGIKRKAFGKILQKISNTIVQTIEQKGKLIIVSIDGISGAGKTTVSSSLKDHLIESGYKVMVDEEGNIPSLDMFLKDREWRKRKTAGIIKNEKNYDSHIDFFDWTAIEKFYSEINGFVKSDEQERTIVIENAYDNITKTYRKRTFRLTRDMIIVIEGQYASHSTIANLRYRIVNDRAPELFEDKIRRLSPDILDGIMKFFQYASVPTWNKYVESNPADFMIDISSAEYEKWEVYSADSAMIGKSSSAPGGIDFNADNLNLKEQGQKTDINFSFDDFQNIEPTNVNGILPVIINITPVTNFPLLIGLSQEKKEENNHIFNWKV